MNVLGLITARGGSKGIPGKNITQLAGRPLLAYTCDAALASRAIARTIISTDDPKIADVARQCGIEAPFIRPQVLATDTAASIDVALHALHWFIQTEKQVPDALLLLQPTSPLRTADHIDTAIRIMHQHRADTVVSVVEVPHRFTPYNVMTLQDGTLQPFWQEEVTFDRYRRQEIPRLYGRNGPAVLATKVNTLLEKKSFYGDTVVPYLMSHRDSIDIDDAFDLEIAECLLSKRPAPGTPLPKA